jgi:hypothetical protein
MKKSFEAIKENEINRTTIKFSSTKSNSSSVSRGCSSKRHSLSHTKGIIAILSEQLENLLP